MSIFSDEEKDFAEELLDLSVKEFSREFLVIKDGKKVAISKDLGYSSIYRRNSQGEKSYETEFQSITVKGTILYGSPAQSVWGDPNVKSQLRVKLPANTVRIRSTKEVYDILKEAKRIELEGKRYSFSTDFKPHGIFTTKFYDVYLQVVDEED